MEFDSAEILRIPLVKSRFVFPWYLNLFINYTEFNCQLQYVYLVVECVLITDDDHDDAQDDDQEEGY